MNAPAKPPKAPIHGGARKVTTIEDLNTRFALYAPRTAASVWIQLDGALPMSDVDFKRRLAPEIVVTGQTKDKHDTYSPASQALVSNPHRRVCTKAAMTNKPVPYDTLNTFPGFGVTPRPGKCGLINRHMREVICAGNEASYFIMKKLIAWQMQNVGTPSRIIVVLVSKQQAGKGIFLSALEKMLGDSCLKTGEMEDVFGRFNSQILGKVIIILDEALFVGDKKMANKVKMLTGNDGLYPIEAKGAPITMLPVGVNIWAASNHENAAYIEEHDQRYWVLEISEDRIGDHSYFAALGNEITNGGLEAFAHELLSMDVSGFVPQRDVPRNNSAKEKMLRGSTSAYDARFWLEACCEAHELVGARTDNGTAPNWRVGDEYTFGQLLDAYSSWLKIPKGSGHAAPTPPGKLRELLTRVGFGSTRSSAQRYRTLPAIEKLEPLIWAVPIDKKSEGEE